MQLRLSVGDTRPAHTDLLIDADPSASVGELADRIRDALGLPYHDAVHPSGLYLDGRQLRPDAPLREAPIRDGIHLGLDGAQACPKPPAQGILEVRVTGGPGAGEIWRLGPGVVTIGGARSDRVQLADPAIPGAAISLTITPDGTATITPGPGAAISLTITPDGTATITPGPGAAATLEAEPVTGTPAWPPGHLLALGRVLLEVAIPDFPDASLRPAEEGFGFDYNRPPRLAPVTHATGFSLPPAPRPAETRSLPWVVAILPPAAALVMAKLFDNVAFLAFALLSPLSLIANHYVDRMQGRRAQGATTAEYLRRRAGIEADVEAALAAELAQRRDGCPDPALVGLIATDPRHQLWERRRRDGDFGLLRIGTGTLPSDVEVFDPDREEHHRRDPLRLHEVPVAVPLSQRGVLGIAGRAQDVRALGRWLVAHSAVLHSPADLHITVLTDQAAAASWDWVGWLPHARPRDGQQSLALLGTDPDTTGRRVSELLAQLAARESASRASGPVAELDVPDLLVVLDGARRLRGLPGVAQLLQDGPRLGIRVICLDTDPRLLPEECRAVATFDDRGQLTLRQTGLDPVAGIRPDLVEVAWCERIARALAPIRDVSREADATLPGACRLLELLNLEPPTGARIAAGWRRGGRTTRAVAGVCPDGPFTIDLVAHGPHGLVAGTTGAGKSELLQTLIASLAVGNRPDEMTFILVDYKGGSAFGDCAELPHTVGMVTDLDPALVTRALESLGAELHRRERLFALAGVPALPEYQAARSRNPTLAAVPRLLIVIDEFASLARELPDFVAGLVNVAQRGRSLGIHLILATQRPAGVVSAEIRANTNLRIALRVTDAAESSDIIYAPDAAWISGSTPGRACARLGHNSLMSFQAGRVGGRRPGANSPGATGEAFVVPIGRESLGLPAPVRPPGAAGPSDDPRTDLAVLVEAVREAAAELAIPRQPSPWLPALPTLLVPDELLADELNRAPDTAERADALRPGVFALVDVPTQQRREVWAIDLPTFGHLFVVGAPRTGRSQVLRTIAGSLARENSSADVHLYGLDAGNGALLALNALPHCGAVVRSSETERSIRLLDKLTAELHRRLAFLGEGQFSDITEQRAAASEQERLPHLVVLIDRWEAVLSSLGEQDHGMHVETVLALAREGVGAGIHLIISGDQTLLGGRMNTLTENKLVLRLADRSDFAAIGIATRSVPDQLPPGRGFRALDGRQVQVALFEANSSGAAQTGALERIGVAARERDRDVATDRRPFAVDVLPTRIRFDAAWQLRPATSGPLWCAVGVGGDRLTAHGPDLATGIPAFLIAGPPGSGRSTALRAVAASYLAVGTRLLLVTPRSSPLRELAGADGVAAVLTGPDLDPAVVKEALLDGGPLVLIIDDAELLRDCSAGPELAAIARRELGERVGIVLAGDPDAVCSGFSGWQVEARKARRGLLLSPQSLIEGELIGVHVPRAMVGRPVEPGRGLLHLGNGRPLVVQVPTP